MREIQPRVVMCENVRGLLSHDKGRTLEVIKATIGELGYHLFEPKVLHAVQYQVPQKRERLILKLLFAMICYRMLVSVGLLPIIAL